MNLAPRSSGPRLHVAFYGRVASNGDGAKQQLGLQYEQCQRALPPGGIITAVFYDVGRSEAGRRPAFDRLTVTGVHAPRDGGLNNLLVEATKPQPGGVGREGAAKP